MDFCKCCPPSISGKSYLLCVDNQKELTSSACSLDASFSCYSTQTILGHRHFGIRCRVHSFELRILYLVYFWFNRKLINLLFQHCVIKVYCVTLCMCSIAFRCSQWGLNAMSNADTRYSMMETKVPDFISTMSRTIKCNHCSKLLVNQQGLFYTAKKTKKIVLYLQMF